MALILDRRQFLAREEIEGHCHEADEQGGDHDGRPHVQGIVERSTIRLTHAVEAAIHECGEAAFLAMLVNESRAHDGR